MAPGLPVEAEAHYRAVDEDARLQRHWVERERTRAVLAHAELAVLSAHLLAVAQKR